MVIWSQTAWKASPSVTGRAAYIFGTILFFYSPYLNMGLYVFFIPHAHFVCVCACVVSPLRWLLLGFQREFEHSDALRLFEILSCDHLELISQQVDRARYQERLARKYNTGESQSSSWPNKD